MCYTEHNTVLTCPKGFGLKPAKLRLKTPSIHGSIQNKRKEKPSWAELNQACSSYKGGKYGILGWWNEK